MLNKKDMHKSSSLNKQLHDALLDISDNDIQETKNLLRASGMNPNDVVKNSLNKISQYRQALEQKVGVEQESSLFDSVKNKISRLLIESPEKTNQFLTGYFKQNSLPVQFGGKVNFDQKVLMNAKDKLDLNDLSKKLDDKDLFKKK